MILDRQRPSKRGHLIVKYQIVNRVAQIGGWFVTLIFATLAGILIFNPEFHEPEFVGIRWFAALFFTAIFYFTITIGNNKISVLGKGDYLTVRTAPFPTANWLIGTIAIDKIDYAFAKTISTGRGGRSYAVLLKKRNGRHRTYLGATDLSEARMIASEINQYLKSQPSSFKP